MAFRLDDPAPGFENLPGVDGKAWSLSSFDGLKAVAVIFSCNHCPYVVAYEERMVDLQGDYAGRGVSLVAINPNNEATHPADRFEKMEERAKARGFNFPYLRDESQEVARAYGAKFTPEVFLLDGERKLAYKGRIDDNCYEPRNVKTRDLRNALDAVLDGRTPDVRETVAVGCTIKWK